MKLRMRKRVGITARMTVIASLIVRMIVEIRVIARAIMRVYMAVRMRVEMRVTLRLLKMKSCTHGFWNTSSRSPVLRRLSSPLM